MTTAPPSSPPTPASPVPKAGSGLSTPAEIEALADELSLVADEIHKRVVKSVKAYKGQPIPEAEQTTARALLDDEMELRQRANGLYADAATLVVASLGKSQTQIMALTATAAERIRQIAHLGQLTGLVASMVGLAAAAATAQPVALLGAIDKVRASIKGVRDTSPPAAT